MRAFDFAKAGNSSSRIFTPPATQRHAAEERVYIHAAEERGGVGVGHPYASSHPSSLSVRSFS